jgi:hypothetical protein
MKKVISLILLVGIGLFVYYYVFIIPRYVLEDFLVAAETRQIEYINAHINHESLKNSLYALSNHYYEKDKLTMIIVRDLRQYYRWKYYEPGIDKSDLIPFPDGFIRFYIKFGSNCKLYFRRTNFFSWEIHEIVCK